MSLTEAPVPQNRILKNRSCNFWRPRVSEQTLWIHVCPTLSRQPPAPITFTSSAGKCHNPRGLSLCIECPPGMEALDIGASSCDRCLPGSFKGDGDMNCSLCGAGEYATEPGPNACDAEMAQKNRRRVMATQCQELLRIKACGTKRSRGSSNSSGSSWNSCPLNHAQALFLLLLWLLCSLS